MDHILYRIFKVIYHQETWNCNWYSSNNNICKKAAKNRMIFKTRAAHYLNFLILDTMKLSRSTKSKITKHENSENVPHFEITEVLLLNCNNVNIDYQQDSRVLHTLACNKSFVYIYQLLDISPQIFIFFKNLLTRNFRILKDGLLIKILNCWRYKIK